jgi:hypothetical protein
MRNTYSERLKQEGLADNTVAAQLHRAGRVEECYGDLDDQYDKDQLNNVISELRYSVVDGRANKPNPSKIPFNGDIRSNHSSYKNAVERYCKFRREIDEDGYSDPTQEATAINNSMNDIETSQLIGLERDMQTVLRRSIEQLEDGLVIIDDCAERSVPSGFIDITAEDTAGSIVVIELKTGTARQRAVAQILSYMGDIDEEESDQAVRGILVAGDFDQKARSAARMVPNLLLKKYKITFEFSNDS